MQPILIFPAHQKGQHRPVGRPRKAPRLHLFIEERGHLPGKAIHYEDFGTTGGQIGGIAIPCVVIAEPAYPASYRTGQEATILGDIVYAYGLKVQQILNLEGGFFTLRLCLCLAVQRRDNNQ